MDIDMASRMSRYKHTYLDQTQDATQSMDPDVASTSTLVPVAYEPRALSGIQIRIKPPLVWAASVAGRANTTYKASLPARKEIDSALTWDDGEDLWKQRRVR